MDDFQSHAHMMIIELWWPSMYAHNFKALAKQCHCHLSVLVVAVKQSFKFNVSLFLHLKGNNHYNYVYKSMLSWLL